MILLLAHTTQASTKNEKPLPIGSGVSLSDWIILPKSQNTEY